MSKTHLPDIDGNPILKSCNNCNYCEDQSDGPEYGPSFFSCEKKGKEHMGNLKGFPFKTPQRCFELSFVYLHDWSAMAKELES